MVGVACGLEPVAMPSGFEPVATPEEFSTCLRYVRIFTQTATYLNPATAWQLPGYAEDLKTYAPVTEAYRQRAEMPREKSARISIHYGEFKRF